MVKEWTIKDIVCHIAADPESVLQIDEIDDKTDGFLRAQGLNPSAQDVADFLKKRPDGVAFRRPVGAQKQLRILEFTRASDTSDDWQEKKEVEKNLRYCQHVKFISELTSWQVEQINFTVGIRGQLHSASFKTTTVLPWHRSRQGTGKHQKADGSPYTGGPRTHAQMLLQRQIQ